MTKRWMMGVAAATLTVATAVAAQAADLPTRKEAPAPVFVPPPFSWTGVYIGAHAGAGWSSGRATTTGYAAGFPVLAINWPTGSNGGGNTGFIGGGQAGYNWQTGQFVLGVETDFDGTSLSRNKSIIGPGFIDPFGHNDFLTSNGSEKLNWLGSTRARVGYAVTSDNRLMIYGTGGFAYGGGNEHLNVFDTNNGWLWYNSQSKTRTGWTIGGGVEYAITYNITLRAEYLYYDLGSQTLTTTGNIAALNAFPGSFASTKVNFDGSVVRAGVNYKF